MGLSELFLHSAKDALGGLTKGGIESGIVKSSANIFFARHVKKSPPHTLLDQSLDTLVLL